MQLSNRHLAMPPEAAEVSHRQCQPHIHSRPSGRQCNRHAMHLCNRDTAKRPSTIPLMVAVATALAKAARYVQPFSKRTLHGSTCTRTTATGGKRVAAVPEVTRSLANASLPTLQAVRERLQCLHQHTATRMQQIYQGVFRPCLPFNTANARHS
jgi:hypothetical protein